MCFEVLTDACSKIQTYYRDKEREDAGFGESQAVKSERRPQQLSVDRSDCCRSPGRKPVNDAHCRLKAAEHHTGEKKQKSGEKSFKAVIANDRNRYVCIANQQRENCEENRKHEGELRRWRQVHCLESPRGLLVWCHHDGYDNDTGTRFPMSNFTIPVAPFSAGNPHRLPHLS